jgi:hypothetical protein
MHTSKIKPTGERKKQIDMSKVKHTPGPWVVAETSAPYSEIEAKGQRILMLYGTRYTQSCNARLIAAAPDMLVVLKEAVDHAHVYDTNPALVELFKAVISKTETQ